MNRILATVALCATALIPAGIALADWPYLTEEASVLGLGHYAVSVGASQTHQDSRRLPGGEGVLWTLPEMDGTLGIGPWAEVSFHYEWLRFDSSESGVHTYESGDLRLWTKLRLFGSRVHDVGVRFGVKFPNASEEHGLGTNQTDIFGSLLWDAHLGRLTSSLNAGFGILDDPEKRHVQDDVVTWGAALRWAIGPNLSVGVDGAGQSGPYGEHRRRDSATFGPILTWRRSPLRIDIGVRRGVEDALGWGWVAGVTYER